MAKPYDPTRSYNAYRPEPTERFQRKHGATYVSDTTKRALEELEYITSWAEFVEICEKQKRKRGW